MLDRALELLGTSLDRLPQSRLDAYLAEARYPRLEALMAANNIDTRRGVDLIDRVTAGGNAVAVETL